MDGGPRVTMSCEDWRATMDERDELRARLDRIDEARRITEGAVAAVTTFDEAIAIVIEMGTTIAAQSDAIDELRAEVDRLRSIKRYGATGGDDG